MFKKLFWLALGSLFAACLGSCAVYKDPTTITYVDINTGIKVGHDLTITEEAQKPPTAFTDAQRATMMRKAMDVAEPVVEAASAPLVKKPPIELCGKYIPPKLAEIPKPSSAEIAAIAKSTSDKQFESMLTLLGRMYQHSKDARDANNAALKTHLGTCKMVSVQ